MTISVELVICEACENGIYTRCAGDSRTCGCGSLVVTQDAFGFNRIEALDSYTKTDIEIRQIEESLFCDFDDAVDKFGLVKNGTKFADVVKSKKVVQTQPRRPFESELQSLASIW